MSTDTKIKTLIFNKLTQEQYNNADKVPTEFYLTPDTSIDSSEKGAANGVASLDTNGKVPAKQIPTATTSTLGGVKPDGNTITVTEDGTISAAISGEVVATKAELQAKVSKAGDTMTGTLKMSGTSELRFGTDDNYYFIKKISNGTFEIYGKNGKGLFLQSAEAHSPFYWDGTTAYRLLTTADLENLDYVVESYKDGTNWYRKYKSGWLEQGNSSPTGDQNFTLNKTINFPKPFADNTYMLVGPGFFISGSGAQTITRTTTGFTTGSIANMTGCAYWYACGQGE